MRRSASQERRPTILIGHRDFGTDVLRRLLASAALRGTLDWEEPEGSAAPSERNLHNLALISVGARAHPAEGGEALELMRDLYEQIQVLDAAWHEGELADAVLDTAKRLRRPQRRGGDRNELPSGLDVLVVAHPSDASEVGLLNYLLQPTLERLDAWLPHLEAPVQSIVRLNFMQVLDFESFWSTSSQRHLDLRRAVCDSLDYWDRRAQERKPAFRRIYLVDSDTRKRSRTARDRAEEIALFLELLLFEGQRAGDLQSLYHRTTNEEAIAATFGIRLLERPTGLLRRLVAASFGVGWLGYIGQNGRDDRSAAHHTRQYLREYRNREFGDLFGREKLQGTLEARLDELEERLLSLPVDTDDWPTRLGREYRRGADEIRRELAAAAGVRMEELHRERLQGFSQALHGAMQKDLHDEENPASPDSLICILGDARSSLGEPQSSHDDEESAEPVGRTLEDSLSSAHALHDHYRCLRDTKVRPDNLVWWWPALAALGTVGLLPFAERIIGDLISLLPVPDPAASSQLLHTGHELLTRMTHPTVIGLLLFVLILTASLLGFHRSLVRRTERAQKFYDHHERGRLAAVVRGGMVPGGGFRSPLDSYLKHLLSDMKAAVFSEIRGELGRAENLLRERRRELGWLRADLRRFLQMNGMNEIGERTTGHSARGGEGLRTSIEKPEDLKALVNTNPLTPGRYRSVHRTIRPFADWNHRYAETFLYPLAFIERLSEEFGPSSSGASAREDRHRDDSRWASDLERFLQENLDCDLSLVVPEGDGVPSAQRLALVPDELALVQSSLDRAHDRVDRVIKSRDSERVYLLNTRIGVPPHVFHPDGRKRS